MRSAFLLMLAIAIVGCDDGSAEPTARDSTAEVTQEPTQSIPEQAPATAEATLEEPTGQLAQVVEVIDGDTIDVLIDGVEERIRYPAINSPERGACFEDEATAANAQLVGGKAVLLERDPDGADRDRYGRLLLYVWADGVLADLHMASLGLAEVQTQYEQKKYFERLLAAQSAAMSAELGVWGACGGLFD
ncbi:MAG TPA: thermonuclease family protein [Dehalococcoidia bacterium]|nr:thermonuclease family protein [Dehalococcoidia bacterium]